jgi:hypothetical protein
MVATIPSDSAMATFSGSPTKYTKTGTVRMDPPEPKRPREIPINKAPIHAPIMN